MLERQGEQLDKKIRLAAMGMLSRREHCQAELLKKLNNQFGSEKDITIQINQQITQLEQEGLQNDQRFCENFVRSRVSRGYGLYKIKHDIKHYGITDEAINDYFLTEKRDWKTLAQEVLSKKFSAQQLDKKIQQKAFNFMAQRGFSTDETLSAMQALLSED